MEYCAMIRNLSVRNERLPDFLVIGAQKSGTTTLFEDLRSHPDIGIGEKESSVLIGTAPDSRGLTRDELRRRYDSILPYRAPSRLLGEVATTYAMLPQHPWVINNATRVIPETKIVYVVREPVSRVVSHHHHDFGLGLTGPDINVAVYDHPPLLDNTRYGTQIEPWLDAYGSDSVLVLRFEDYVANRQVGASKVFEFLGVSAFQLPDSEVVYNAAGTKHVGVGALGWVASNNLYRSRVRPLVPESIRRQLAGMFLPKAPPRPGPPTPRTIAFLVRELWPEVIKLADLLRTDLWWDRDEVLRSWLGRDAPTGHSDQR